MQSATQISSLPKVPLLLNGSKPPLHRTPLCAIQILEPFDVRHPTVAGHIRFQSQWRILA